MNSVTINVTIPGLVCTLFVLCLYSMTLSFSLLIHLDGEFDRLNNFSLASCC